MPAPGKAWWHVWWGTLYSWLPGSPKGFRSAEHRIHSSGDYKHPPPPGEHAGLYRYHKSRHPDPIKIPRHLRLLVAEALAHKLIALGHRAMVTAVGPTHAHGVTEMPIDLRTFNKAIGDAKNAASRKVRKTLPGRIWARGDKHRMLRDREQRHDAYLYVRDKQGPSAAVWCHDEQYTRDAEID